MSKFNAVGKGYETPILDRYEALSGQAIFFEIHANPIFKKIAKIFGKNLGNLQKVGEIEISRIHVKNSLDSRILFRFSRIHATKMHAFAQPAWGLIWTIEK